MDCSRRVVLTAAFLKNGHGYTGYFAELPGVSAHGRTIEQARDSLRRLVALVFEEERRAPAEMLADREVRRELLYLSPPQGDIEPAITEQAADRRVPATS